MISLEDMKQCVSCEQFQPLDKYNLDSRSPDHCFRCRIQTVKIGFGGHRESFHGDALHGGTIASENRFTVEEGRKRGLDPVPVKSGETTWVPSKSNVDKLKTALGG